MGDGRADRDAAAKADHQDLPGIGMHKHGQLTQHDLGREISFAAGICFAVYDQQSLIPGIRYADHTVHALGIIQEFALMGFLPQRLTRLVCRQPRGIDIYTADHQ